MARLAPSVTTGTGAAAAAAGDPTVTPASAAALLAAAEGILEGALGRRDVPTVAVADLSGELLAQAVVMPTAVLVLMPAGGLQLLLVRGVWLAWGSITASQLPDDRFTAGTTTF